MGGCVTKKNGKPDINVNSQDFLLRVSLGLEKGYSLVEKYGKKPVVNTADGFIDIWDGSGQYVPPTQARIHDVVSTDATDAGTVISAGTATGGSVITLIDSAATFISDGVLAQDEILNDALCEIGRVSSIDSETQISIIARMRSPETGIANGGFDAGQAYRIVRPASTGASIFFVKGNNAFLLAIDEFVVLNGLTPVATVKSYLRQSRARVFSAGNTGAAGVITSTAQVDGTVSCQVIDGNNQTLMAIYTIPSNTTGYIVSWWGSVGKKVSVVSTVRLRAGLLDEVSYVQQERDIASSGDSSFDYEFKLRLPIVGGADLWIEADADANGAAISGGLTILLEDL